MVIWKNKKPKIASYIFYIIEIKGNIKKGAGEVFQAGSKTFVLDPADTICEEIIPHKWQKIPRFFENIWEQGMPTKQGYVWLRDKDCPVVELGYFNGSTVTIAPFPEIDRGGFDLWQPIVKDT